jgi:hypothetical protein
MRTVCQKMVGGSFREHLQRKASAQPVAEASAIREPGHRRRLQRAVAHHRVERLTPAMEGYQVTTIDEAAAQGHIFITATANIDVITIDHMRHMKDRAIVCNIGHFDSET